MLLNDFYTITSQTIDDGKITSMINIKKGHDIFKGHFPGQPVVPGVCLTEIVKELIENQLNHKLVLVSGSNLKFMAVVDPEKTPDLTYEITYKVIDGQISANCSTTFGETVAFKIKSTYNKK